MAIDSAKKRAIAKGLLPLKSGDWEFVETSKYYDSVDWQHLSVAAARRDSLSCQDCGTKRREIILEVHHWRYPDKIRIDGLWYINVKGDHLDNLVTLCRHCHRRRHKLKPLTDEEVLIKPDSLLYVPDDDDTVAPLDFNSSRKSPFDDEGDEGECGDLDVDR